LPILPCAEKRASFVYRTKLQYVN